MTPDGAGGFSMVIPILLDGVQVSDVEGVMTAGGSLTITLVTMPGAVPLTDFQAWQKGV
jgi:hypothetical protein